MNKRAYSSADYAIVLPEGHRFPMQKYAAVRQALLNDGTFLAESIVQPPRAEWLQVERVHTHQYLHKLRFGELNEKELRLLGFPWSLALIERALRAAGGTLAAAHDALACGLGINLAGGTHHAFAGHGEGFCLLNDVAIAVHELLALGLVQRIFILDLDVHQGNGTANIFLNNPHVFTLSVHGARNYPFQKQQSSLDIGLPDGVEDAEYLQILQSQVFPAMRVFAPQLVFYLAGVDVLAQDRFGRFALSVAGTALRDQQVFEHCRDADLPVVSLMSGGYNRQAGISVLAHANTVRQAMAVFSKA